MTSKSHHEDDSQPSISQSSDDDSFSFEDKNEPVIIVKKAEPIIVAPINQSISNSKVSSQNESFDQSYSLDQEEYNKMIGKKSQKNDSIGDFNFDDSEKMEEKQKILQSSSFEKIESKEASKQFSKLQSKGNTSSGFMNLENNSKSSISSYDLSQSPHRTQLKNSNPVNVSNSIESNESSKSSDSLISSSRSTLNQNLISSLDTSQNSYVEGINEGIIKLNGKKVINMMAVDAMKKKTEDVLVPYEQGEKIIDQNDQRRYLEKLKKEEKKVKEQDQKEKERRRKLLITNLLTRIKVQVIEENQNKYSRIFLKTQRLSRKTPLIQQDGSIFVLDLEISHENHPIDHNFFKKLRKWPKQLIYTMILGPHLTQKMIERIFRLDWSSLRRIEFHRNVRENVLPLETIYDVTENKNNFQFLNQFKYKHNLQFIAVVGNYFTNLMGNSLFTQKFLSLKQLVIDYDAIISKELFENLLSAKPFNLDNTEVIIYFNEAQYSQLRQLINEYFHHLKDQIDKIRFLERKVQVQNRPYTKELNEIIQDEKDNEKEKIKDNDNADKMQEEEIISMPNDKDDQGMIAQESTKLTVEQIQQLLEGIKNIELESQNIVSETDDIFYSQNVDPIKLKGHMWGAFGQDFDLQSMDDLKNLIKDMDFYTKYQKYNEAFKQTKLLQFLNPEITQEYCDQEHETDVFTLNYAQETTFQNPITLEKIEMIKNWNRFLFTAIKIGYQYQEPDISKEIFNMEWQNVKSVMLEKIKFRSFVSIKDTNTMKKVKCSQVKLEMFKNYNLNQKLLYLKLSGERLPSYLAKDLVEMEFKNLEQLCLFFVKKIRRKAIKILTCTRFRNLNPDCHIVIHTHKGKQDKRFYKYLVSRD